MNNELKTSLTKVDEDSEIARLKLPKVPSSRLSKQIDKFVNACRNIRKDIAGAYEEYQIVLKIAREEDFGDYATNLIIRSRLAAVGDSKVISSMMRALGVKPQFLTPLEQRHPRQASQDAEDQDDEDEDEDDDEYDDEDEDEDDEDETEIEGASFPTKVILELHSDIFKKIYLVYVKNKENDNDQLIKLVAEVRCSSNDVKLYGGSILNVKK